MSKVTEKRQQEQMFPQALRVLIDSLEIKDIDSFSVENHFEEGPSEEGYMINKPTGWRTVSIVFKPRKKKKKEK